MQSHSLAEIIRSRSTQKVLAAVDAPAEFPESVIEFGNQAVLNAIDAAGWAPFHYDRALGGIAEPWRVHVLWQPACRKLASEFFELFSDIKPTNKLPSMLAGCGALALVTWLPQFAEASGAESVDRKKQIEIDTEHVAAASAMVQNMLLMLTADGLGTYWSSGGQLRTPEAFEHLGIPNEEQLLAAVFVDYTPEQTSGIERLPGKQRSKRSASASWTRQIDCQ